MHWAVTGAVLYQDAPGTGRSYPTVGEDGMRWSFVVAVPVMQRNQTTAPREYMASCKTIMLQYLFRKTEQCT